MTADQIAARAAERRRKETERLAAQEAQILKDMQASTKSTAGAADAGATAAAAAAAPASAVGGDVSALAAGTWVQLGWRLPRVVMRLTRVVTRLRARH